MKTIRPAKVSRFLAVALLSFACLAATAQDIRILHHFTGGTNDGAEPYGSLIQSGSTLYGMAYKGGSKNLGAVFKMNTDGTGFEVLHSFVSAGNDGQRPMASLIVSGSTLYGMAASVMTSSGGTIFKMQTDGSDFGVLHRFTGTEGKWPYGDLIQSGSLLYGMTAYGGNNTNSGYSGNGTLFQINTNGTDFQVLHTFAGTPGDGAGPHGTPLMMGSSLYGITAVGGSNGVGAIYRFDTANTNYQILHHFTGPTNDGSYPVMNRLVPSGSTLFAETSGGGSNDYGTVFRMNTDGSGFALLHSFNGTEGSDARGGLVLSGSTLYGITWFGGTGWSGSMGSGKGVIYQIGTNGTGFQVLHKFAGGTSDGAAPQSSLTLSGSTLYGMTSTGGRSNKGVIFALDLPVPTLAISLNNTNVSLSWNTNCPNFTLESTEQLTGSWTPVSCVTGYSATLPVNAVTNQFFRLRN